MNIDQLKIELARWAEFQSMRHQPPAKDEDGPGFHPLSRAREFAPGTRQAAAKALKGRNGYGRLAYMGERGSAVSGSDIAPSWSCDPIVCTETRHYGPPLASIDRGIPPGWEWVDHGLAALQREHRVRAICVRVEVTVQASQGTKARIAAEEYGGHLSKWQYRRELQLGLSFMAGLKT